MSAASCVNLDQGKRYCTFIGHRQVATSLQNGRDMGATDDSSDAGPVATQLHHMGTATKHEQWATLPAISSSAPSAK